MVDSMPTPPSKRIFVTGAAGFVGSAVVEELLGRGFEVTALVHRGQLRAGAGRVQIVQGDLFAPAALDQGIAGCAAVIHLVGIIRENARRGSTFDRIHFQGAKNVMEAARRAGVGRFIHMSALGARADAASQYHKSKFQAEQALRESGESGLDWTILRPSLIHGPGGEFLSMEAGWARGRKPPFLFMPYFSAGLLGRRAPASVQPVYVNDVARAFVDAIDNPQTIAQAYGVCGSQRLLWPQMHHIAAEIFRGKRKATLAIPAWYGKFLTHVVPESLLPFTRDQVTMALEDSTCDMMKFAADFGWEPGGFEETLRGYAAEV
jgi:nucleoside-diphosphate-sugar epimerase